MVKMFKMCNVCKSEYKCGVVVWMIDSHSVGVGGLITPPLFLITSQTTSHKGSPQWTRWVIFSHPSACWSRLEVCEVGFRAAVSVYVCVCMCVSARLLWHKWMSSVSAAHWLSFTIHELCWKELSTDTHSLTETQHCNDNVCVRSRVRACAWVKP